MAAPVREFRRHGNWLEEQRRESAENGRPREFWDPPKPYYDEGERTRVLVEWYATENARLRLKLDDWALLDREWHRHQGPWIPKEVEESTELTLTLNKERLQEQKRVAIKEALRRTQWRQDQAATILGVSPRVLHYYIKELKIKREYK